MALKNRGTYAPASSGKRSHKAYTGYDGLVYMWESNPKGKGTLLKSVSSRASGVGFRDSPLPPESNLLVIRDFNPKLTSAPGGRRWVHIKIQNRGAP